MEIGTPLDLNKNGRYLRAKDLGLAPETNSSFDGNQSFPRTGKNQLKKSILNPRLPLWKHAILNAVEGSCSFTYNENSASSSFTQATFETSVETEAENSFHGTPAFANPYKGIVTVDAETTQILVSNSVMTEITGYSSQELHSMRMSDLITQEKSSYALQSIEDRLTEELSSSNRLAEIVSKDGLKIGVLLWITKVESEGLFRFIIVIEPVRRIIAQFHLDDYGTVMDADEFSSSIFECREADFVNHNIRNWIPDIKLPEPGHELSNAMRKQETTGSSKVRSFPLMLYLNYYEGESDFEDTGDALPYYTAIVWLFASISGLFTINEKGNILDCNSLFAHLALGYSREDLVNKPVGCIITDFPEPEEIQSGEYHDNAVHSNGSIFAIRYFIEGPFQSNGASLYHIWISWSQQNLSSLSSLTWQVTQSSSHTANCTQSRECIDIKGPEKTVAETSVFNDEGFSGDFSTKYEAVRQIGKGGFGYVQLCFRKFDGQEFVAKFINKSKVYPESWIETDEGRLPFEIHYLTKIEHSNIVRMVEFMENSLYFQVIMEKHGPGMDLFEFIERTNGVSENLASFIFRQVIDAVQYLHSIRILHRDIKDENIIIDDQFRIKLIDFGSATEFDGEKLFSVFCGTFEYCSPEVLRGKPYRGPELEVWSLGVTLYVLVFGCNPFANIEETIKAVLRFPFQVSEDLEVLLSGMLDIVVSRRLTLKQIALSTWMNQIVDVSCYNFYKLVSLQKNDDVNLCSDFSNLVTSTPFKKEMSNSVSELCDESISLPPAKLIFSDEVDK